MSIAINNHMSFNLHSEINPNVFPAETNDFWATLFDELPYLVLVFDREGNLMLANNEASRRLRLEGEEAISFTQLFPFKSGNFDFDLPSGQSKILEIPTPVDGNPIRFTVRHLPYGDSSMIMATSQPVSTNNNESLDETAQLAQAVSQKMGDPLAGIELYASIVGRELEEAGDSALADLMEHIRAGVREVNEYLTSFASMAKPLSLNLENHQLADIVDEALGALNGVLKERNIGILVTQKDFQLEVDRALLVQLFLNLFLNAVEAVGQNGRIFVEFELSREGMIEVIITDTGAGVPLAKMKQIFSPFYTTKEGQSLGLGLPVSLRIVEAHQGRLIVGQDLNMGARAVVSLPHLPAPKTASIN